MSTENKAQKLFAEVTVPVDGEEMTLRIDFNALAEFEEKTGQKALDAIAEIESGEISIVLLRHFVWAGLQYYHPGCSVGKAGDFLSADSEALAKALSKALPQAEERTDQEDPQAGN